MASVPAFQPNELTSGSPDRKHYGAPSVNEGANWLAARCLHRLELAESCCLTCNDLDAFVLPTYEARSLARSSARSPLDVLEAP